MKTILKRILGCFILLNVIPIINMLLGSPNNMWINYLIGWGIDLGIIFGICFVFFVMWCFESD